MNLICTVIKTSTDQILGWFSEILTLCVQEMRISFREMISAFWFLSGPLKLGNFKVGGNYILSPNSVTRELHCLNFLYFP